jgi:hypothetical protein
MKKALINPIDLIDGKSVVVDVRDTQYDASVQYFWVECNDNVQIGWLYDNGQFAEPPPPPPVPLPTPTAEENKAKAINKLSKTDWVEIPSVTDPSITPHLLNKDEFIQFRSYVRAIAINPIEGNVQWPAYPQEQWSN